MTPAGALYAAQHMRARDREEFKATRFDTDDFAADVAEGACYVPDMGWEFCIDGVVIGVVGVRPLWPTVWYAWMYATDDYDKVILTMTKWIRRVIIPMLWNGGARRVETKSLAKNTEAHKWLEFMGAVLEAPLEAYGKNGEDFVVHKWIHRPGTIPKKFFRRRG